MSNSQFIERDILSEGSSGGSMETGFQTWATDWSENQFEHPGMGTYLGGLHTEGFTTNKSYSINYRETKGWDIPNFADKKRQGKLLSPTPFIQTEVKGSITGSYKVWYRNFDPDPTVHSTYNHFDYESDLECRGLFLPSDFLSQHSAAVQDFGDLESLASQFDASAQVQGAAAKIYSSGFDALTSSAEFHKVIKLFIGLKKRLIKEISAGRLYNLWLEGRYGWRVLIFEMLDLNDALVNFNSKREVYTDFAFGRQTTNRKYTSNSVGVGTPPDIVPIWQRGAATVYKLHYTEKEIVSLKGTVSAYASPRQFEANFAVTAWELIPYSFVIDWFIGVGKWIQSLAFDGIATEFVAAEGVKVTKTRTYSAVHQGFSNSSWELPDNDKRGLYIDGQIEASFTTRSPTDSISSIPQIAINLDAFKVADLIALLYSARR